MPTKISVLEKWSLIGNKHIELVFKFDAFAWEQFLDCLFNSHFPVWLWSVDLWDLLIQNLGAQDKGLVIPLNDLEVLPVITKLYMAVQASSIVSSAAEAQTEPSMSGFRRTRARLHIWHLFCCLGSELAKRVRSDTNQTGRQRVCPTRPSCSQT